MRRFHLLRLEDETGTSGKGVVAEGVVFTDGTTIIRWNSPTASTIIYSHIDHVLKVHGHGNKTTIVWKDD
jgi:hypothetical protein